MFQNPLPSKAKNVGHKGTPILQNGQKKCPNFKTILPFGPKKVQFLDSDANAQKTEK